MYMYICLSPISFAGLASKETQFMTTQFFKSLANLILQNSGIYLALIIFTVYISSGGAEILTFDSTVGWALNMGFQSLVLVGLVKGMDTLIHKITGLG